MSTQKYPALKIPEELKDWAAQNELTVLRIQTTLMESAKSLSNNDLWEILASSHSPEWRQARDAYAATEKELTDPYRIPLGAIGQGLDGGRMASVEEMHSLALANFTIINENLHQQAEMEAMLGVMKKHQRAFDAAHGRNLATKFSRSAHKHDEPEQVALTATFGKHNRPRRYLHHVPERPLYATINDTLKNFLHSILHPETPEPAKRALHHKQHKPSMN